MLLACSGSTRPPQIIWGRLRNHADMVEQLHTHQNKHFLSANFLRGKTAYISLSNEMDKSSQRHIDDGEWGCPIATRHYDDEVLHRWRPLHPDCVQTDHSNLRYTDVLASLVC